MPDQPTSRAAAEVAELAFALPDRLATSPSDPTTKPYRLGGVVPLSTEVADHASDGELIARAEVALRTAVGELAAAAQLTDQQRATLLASCYLAGWHVTPPAEPRALHGLRWWGQAEGWPPGWSVAAAGAVRDALRRAEQAEAKAAAWDRLATGVAALLDSTAPPT
jgi:hypothetical protein